MLPPGPAQASEQSLTAIKSFGVAVYPWACSFLPTKPVAVMPRGSKIWVCRNSVYGFFNAMPLRLW